MRLLMLAPRAPFPADHGAALRNLYLLRWLGARHEVTLVSFGDPEDVAACAELAVHAHRIEIVPFPRRSRLDRLRTLLFSLQPDLARRLWSVALIDRLGRVLAEERPDLVQIEGLEMASLWHAVRDRQGAVQPIVVLDEHNAEYRLQESAWRGSRATGDWLGAGYSWIQAVRLRRFEREAIREAQAVLAVSGEDAKALRALDPAFAPLVIPNGVDTDHYVPPPNRLTDGRTALFLGKLDYRPNVDALDWLTEAIWPLVRARIPDARLAIVGRDPTERIARRAGRDGLELIGPVADDRPWFHRADLLLVPMRMGGGVRLKVLQAMATGTPIVATAAGLAGSGAEPGRHALQADNATDFAETIVRALTDPGLRAALAGAGRELARQRFDWRVILPELDRYYGRLVAPA